MRHIDNHPPQHHRGVSSGGQSIEYRGEALTPSAEQARQLVSCRPLCFWSVRPLSDIRGSYPSTRTALRSSGRVREWLNDLGTHLSGRAVLQICSTVLRGD
ncbi:hypothetical protein U1Q18_039446, partial [Sarracenia purpurea var. burkii]